MIEKDDGVLYVDRIHVRYRLELADPELADAARRAHELHHPKCPVYKTVSGCIRVTTELELIEV